MNIVTGAKGFIGNHFACTVDKPLEIDIDNCFELLNKFTRWDEVDTIIHMGALSSTVNKDIDAIYKYNIDYSIKLFESYRVWYPCKVCFVGINIRSVSAL